MISKLFSRTVTTIMLLTILNPIYGQQNHATEIVRKSDQLMQGNSYVSTMTMKIVRPSWERTIVFKSWVG